MPHRKRYLAELFHGDRILCRVGRAQKCPGEEVQFLVCTPTVAEAEVFFACGQRRCFRSLSRFAASFFDARLFRDVL